MKNLILTLIIPLCILLTAVSCQKSNALKYGGFSCKVNGRLWEPYTNDFKLQPTECIISQEGKSISIRARNTNKNEHISILVNSLDNVITEGKYLLNSDRYFWGSYDKPFGDFITGNGYEGEIEIIKIDRVTKKMTGKFFFNCNDKQTNETVNVTQGEFNLRYYVY